MNTYEIDKQDFNGKDFDLRDIAEFLGEGFQNQSFIFEGFVFNICISGSAKIKINYQEYEITANSLFVIFPKHIFSIRECSPDLDIKIVFISLDFLYHLPITPDWNLFKGIDMYPCVKLDEGQLNDMLKIYSVTQHYRLAGKLSHQIQTTLTLSIILMITSCFENLQPNPINTYSRQENLTRSFFTLLLKFYGTERSVSFYANKLCITPKYLTMVVKSVTNHSVQNWINEVVLIEAKRLIRTTELTIQQISEKLHFSTASSFVRFFRMHTGYTPLDYRKEKEK